MRSKTKGIISLVLILAMVLQISPLSVLTINAAEAKELVVTETGVKYVYYDDISTYRSGTLSYPKEEGYVFGGWWSETSVDDNGLIANPIAISATDVDVSAWAKYVPEDVLTVKAQVSERVADVIQEDGTLVADTSLKLRLITSVDDSDLYETIGIKVKVNKEKAYETHIYDSLSVREKNNTGNIEPEDAFHKAASQFATVVIGGFDSIERINETELCVTPYWKTLDGTTVEGIARTRLLTSDDRSSDVDGSQTSGEVDFAVSNDRYSYDVTAQSETVSYKYFKGASNTVYLKGQYTPSGADVKFGLIIRNGGQTRQVLFNNAGVLVTNGVDGESVTASGLVSGSYDAYDDVTNADGVYVWARNASVADDGTTYVATSSAIMDLLAGTSAKDVTWAIEENVLYCNIAGETVLRLPMNLLCEQWQDGRYYQVGVAAYNVAAQDTNDMVFEKTALTFGKNAYATDNTEGIISEENDVAAIEAMAYEPITGAYKAATQAGTAYAYGEASTDAQLLTTTIQLPEGDSITSSNGIYLKSGAVYATILIGGNGTSVIIRINDTTTHWIEIKDWIEKAGIAEYYTDTTCELTVGIQDETLYLFINDKLAGGVDLYKLLTLGKDSGTPLYYVEGSYVQLGVCSLDSYNGNASFKESSLIIGDDAETELASKLLDEDQEVAREWELYASNQYYTNGTGYNMTSNGYDHTTTTANTTGNCHIYGVPTTMPQKISATLTSTGDTSKNGIIVRYSQVDVAKPSTTYVYCVEGFESTIFNGYDFSTGFNFNTNIHSETFDSTIYKEDENGNKTYEVTAIVMNGYIYISYNDEVMIVDQLPSWTDGTAVRLGLYSKPSSDTELSVYEDVSFEAGADVEVPKFMIANNISYDETTKTYTPDSSQTGLTYTYNTAANSSQLMSTTISLPEDDSISSSNGLYLKSGDVYATILLDGAGTDINVETNDTDSYKFSLKNWISNAGITEYYKNGTRTLTAGIMDDTLYLFINGDLAGSIDLYKILSFYSSSCYVEGMSTVQIGMCAVNPAGGLVSFKDYSLKTDTEAEVALTEMLATEDQTVAREWEKITNNYHKLFNTGYYMDVDGYNRTAETNKIEKCHVYGVPTSMPQKLSATLTSTDINSGNGIVVRLGTSGTPTYIYGANVGENTLYGIKNNFNWSTRATSNVFCETLEEDVYRSNNGSYTYDITAIVKDGFINIYYNDEIMFTDYLDGWSKGTVVRLGLFAYTVNSTDKSTYENISFEAGSDIELDRTEADPELQEILQGKKISVLGDSISTYLNVSNGNMAAVTNSTIEKNINWYDGSELDSWKHTYWGRMIEKYDMSLCVNNSASGGMLVRDRDVPGRVAGITRCEQLHDNTGDDAGTTPDIITLYLGANDLMQNVEAGELTEDTYASIKDSDGNYITDDLTYTQGYIILLDKVTKLYPDADIFCFTLLPTGNEKSGYKSGGTDDYGNDYTEYRARRLQFNERIREIAAHYGATVVDLEKYAGFTPDNMSVAFEGSHPLYQGIYQVSKVFEDALKTKYCSN